MFRSTSVLILAAIALSACAHQRSFTSESYDDAVARRDALHDEFHDMSPVSPADLPTTGEATYEGIMSLDLWGTSSDTPAERLAGDMDITVRFDPASSRPVIGQASNFYSEDGTSYDGLLEMPFLRPARLDRTAEPGTGEALEGSFVGTLDPDNGSDQGSLQIDTTFNADFYASDNSEGVAGPMTGTATGDDGSLSVTGSFLTTRRDD